MYLHMPDVKYTSRFLPMMRLPPNIMYTVTLRQLSRLKRVTADSQQR